MQPAETAEGQIAAPGVRWRANVERQRQNPQYFRMKNMNAKQTGMTLILIAAVALAVVAGLRIMGARSSATVSAQEPVAPDGGNRGRRMPPKKIDPNSAAVPNAGIAEKSQEEIDAVLLPMSHNERRRLVSRFQQERLWSDAIAVIEWELARTETADQEYADDLRILPSLRSQTRGMGALEKDLKTALEKRPNSLEVRLAVVDASHSLPIDRLFVNGEYVYQQDHPDGSYGGEYVYADERMRVQRLRILAEGLKDARALLEKMAEGAAPSELPMRYLASVKNEFESGRAYWQLQVLTDLENLPDYSDVPAWNRSPNRGGAPVDENGDPIFFKAPESFETAKNDGERVRALQDELFEYGDSEMKANVLLERANAANGNFGVQTLATNRRMTEFDGKRPEDGIWSLHTLRDNETICALAGGNVRRLELPADYDYIALMRDSLEFSWKYYVVANLAREYENRRQLDKAAETWKIAINWFENKKNLQPSEKNQLQEAKNRLSQIVDPRVEFDSASTYVRGMNPGIALRYRNATGAKIVIKELFVNKVLDQLEKDAHEWRYTPSVRARIDQLLWYETSKGLDPDLKRAEIKPLPNDEKLIGGEVASFEIALEPDPDHYDCIENVELPELPSGTWLIEATAKDGNVDYGVFSINSRAIVERSSWKSANEKKPEGAGNVQPEFYVCDSESGKPLPGQKVRFVCDERRPNAKTRAYETATDDQGFAQYPKEAIDLLVGKNYLFSVRVVLPSNDPERPQDVAYFDSNAAPIHFHRLQRDVFTRRNAFFISDRPIYRPKQAANFKFWVGDARYDAPEKGSEWAGKTVAYVIYNPTGEIAASKEGIVLDEYGAFSDAFEIPGDAKLGQYNVMLGMRLEGNGVGEYLGSGYFRLEEYRKPEFKVDVDAPKDPVVLGDAFRATVQAKYYFGAPVAKGTVHYKVLRTEYESDFFPARYWDWFYGPGYWQFTYNMYNYPGWRDWGVAKLVSRPFRDWYGFPSAQPEVVTEGDAEIGEDGTFDIEIDSAIAKENWPLSDHKYEIEATVTDQSRRSITGKGSVFAARKPFKTWVWFDRGYFKVGDKMTAHFQARRIDGKPVPGSGVVKLYKVEYAEDDELGVKPVETEVFSQDATAGEDGKGSVVIRADKPGQYRLSCVVKSENGVEVEGGQLVCIRGAENSPAVKKAVGDYRFTEIEIVPDKPEYAPGDVAKIMLASRRADAWVLFMTRSENGLSVEKPQLVQLSNGTAYVDLPIKTGDQPNIFVEAWTVFEGSRHSEIKELVVPPQKRVLDVAVEPVKERVKPGEKAKIKLKLTDPEGNPVVGQTVATIYDQSLEAISGGSNIPDIRDFFWSWRRSTHPNGSDNLSNSTFWNVFWQILRDRNKYANTRLERLGLFGVRTTINRSAAAGRVMYKGGAKTLATTNDAIEIEDFEMAEESVEEMAMAPAAAPMMARAVNGMALAKEEAVLDSLADASFAMADMDDDDMALDAPAEPEEQEEKFAEATVRSNLADLAFWAVDLKPGDNGEIEIEVDMPDNLTTWKIAAWTVGDGLRVGSGTSEIITSKNLIVRMQKPRFLTQKDEVVLSAIAHNYLDSAKRVRVSLEFPENKDGSPRAEFEFAEPDSAVRTIEVPAGGEARVDWRVTAKTPGEATLLMKALTDEESDAIQDVVSVKEHGIDKQVAVSGLIPAPAESEDVETARESVFKLTVPEERREETTKLTVRVSPTLAGAILDALPYMMEYPYGCTEQTLNKFYPLAIAHKAMIDSGVDLETLKEKRVNLNAQELGDAKTRAALRVKSHRAANNPVFDTAQSRALVAAGAERLASMQNADGGWGWFPGDGSWSSARLTALITRGLFLARQCDFDVDEGAIQRGREWLERYEREQTIKMIRGRVWDDEKKREGNNWRLWKSGADSEDAYVYYALSALGVEPAPFSEDFVNYETADVAADLAAVHSVMRELVWDSRSAMSLYPLATYAIAVADEKNAKTDETTKTRLQTILRIFKEYRRQDDENQTVRLDLGNSFGWYFWSWFGSEYETEAYYLTLLTKVDESVLKSLGLEKDAPQVVKHLLNSRRNATWWNSTKDTAICVEAFSNYLKKTNELAPNEKVEIFLDGEPVKTIEYTPENLFLTDGTLVLESDSVSAGEHEVKIRVAGDGPLYYNAYLEYFTLEDPIEKAGLEVKADRHYYRLVEKQDATALVSGSRGQALRQRVEAYERIPLSSGDEVVSGDLVEVELVIESKNDYESILIEDRKAAGYEAVDAWSGYRYEGIRSYVEFRDDRVCFFAENLPEGRTILRYRLRAETPGAFSALPAKIEAMYAPELKGNSDEFKAKIRDKE